MPCRSTTCCVAPEFCSWAVPATGSAEAPKTRTQAWQPLQLSTRLTAARASSQSDIKRAVAGVAASAPSDAEPAKRHDTAADNPQPHPVFCGAYAALQCAATEPAVQGMLQLQALAVADPALCGLTSLHRGAVPSCFDKQEASGASIISFAKRSRCRASDATHDATSVPGNREAAAFAARQAGHDRCSPHTAGNEATSTAQKFSVPAAEVVAYADNEQCAMPATTLQAWQQVCQHDAVP